MSKEIVEIAENDVTRRRGFIRGAGLLVANLGMVTMVSPALAAQTDSDAEPDVNILQGALAIEHEGIAAYRLAAGSGLLTPGTLKVATIFMGHHQQHRDSL